MATTLRTSPVVASLACSLLMGASALGADPPSAADALRFQPVQGDVQVDTPAAADVERCTIKAERIGKASGWVVRDPQGMILRRFADTNGDNRVDQWCYYRFGVEVYRDVDANFNSKADQYRWLNTAGSRVGIDTNEDKKIDLWANISAEEVSAELVGAIRDRDPARFARLLVNDKDLKSLGLGKEKAEQLAKKLQLAPANFATLVKQQTTIKPSSKWVSFAASQPGIVPAGTEDSTADVLVYENAAAMVDTEDKPLAINVGTLVRTAGGWRLIDAPQIEDGTVAEAEARTFFFASQRSERADMQVAEKPSDKAQELMEQLHKLGDMRTDSTPAENAQRADLLEKLAAESSDEKMRAMWIRQLADMLSAAVQTGTYPDGIQRLKALEEKLKQNPPDEELAFYAQFRWMTAEHNRVLADPATDYAKIQTKWIEDLEAFVNDAKKYPDSADAMLELAISQEFAGEDDKALAWYDAIVKDFPESTAHAKATGAKTRLSSVGQPIPLQGQLANGNGTFDLSKLRGKAVLVQYWATWCEPCKSDLPLLKELRSKYKEFEVVGVNLDNNKNDMIDFLRTNNPGWPQLFEEGGLESRFATEMGIQTLPTMILIDKQGRVVDRNIRAQGLESELTKLLK
ncbi:MAG: TlpA disulfide reductase family protein [Pirellulales bacterium]